MLNGNGTEWIDADLPTPNYFYHLKGINGYLNSYCIAYLIDGYFKTSKNQNYLNDIIARIILTLPVLKRLGYAPSEENKQIDTIYHLKDFKALKSLTKEYVPKLKGQTPDDDVKFWEIKLFIENQIKKNGGEGSFVDFTTIFEHALHFYEWKDNSTCKAKIRNIWNWYENRDWQYHMLKKTNKTKGELLMTRQERARANAVKREKESRMKVINAVTGLYAAELKKVNGTWSIVKIADFTKLTPKTVSKHLKNFEKEKNRI